MPWTVQDSEINGRKVRILGDLSHLVSIFILLQKMRVTRVSIRTATLVWSAN